MAYKIGVVVVTYNRVKVLKESLDAILTQTYPVDKIVIVDNASKDETPILINEYAKNFGNKIVSIRLPKNVGGAGGFYEGIKAYCNIEVDYIWLMDDDTVPTKNALKYLVQPYIDGHIPKEDLVCSVVKWVDGSLHLMNIPSPHQLWPEKVGKGLVRVKGCSFVSVLIPKKVVHNIGLPIKGFFIWGDDVEYTFRASNRGYGLWLVGNSVVVHKTKRNAGTNILIEDSIERIKRYYYKYRNWVYIYRKYFGGRSVIKFMISAGLILIKILFKKDIPYRWFKILQVVRGLLAGVLFNPKIEYCSYEPSKFEKS